MPRKVIEAARAIADAGERAAYLERQLARVAKPARLVDPLLDAMFDANTNGDEVGAQALELAQRHLEDVDFLVELGCSLDNCYRDNEAVEILRLVVPARTRARRALEALGRMLTARGDVQGVPLLEQAIERAPAWAEPRIALAAWFIERDPERALATLGNMENGRAFDVRAMAQAAAGRLEDAEADLALALAAFETELLARKELSEWHYSQNRFIRARVHAYALIELRGRASPGELSAFEPDDIDNAILQAYRRGGGFDDILPWLRERFAHDVPAGLAADLFEGLVSTVPFSDVVLATRAGEVLRARDERDGYLDGAQRWRVRIAGVQASARGDTAALEALACDGLADRAPAWIELADQYRYLGYPDAAHAALDRALQIDPDSAEALDTLFTLALDGGDLGTLERAARALAKAEPRWHQGPENLARAYARAGEGAFGLVHARKAVQLAPYCHDAWLCLGEAQLVAGNLTAAREAAHRARAIAPGAPVGDLAILDAALARDPGALDHVLGLRYSHLPALPFPAFLEKLRAVARAMP